MSESEPIPLESAEPAAGPAPLAEPPREHYPFWTWTDLLMLIGLALPLLVVAMLFVQALLHFLPLASRARAVAPITAQFGFYALWFFVVYALIRLRYNRPFLPSLAFSRPAWGYARAFLLGILTAVACALIGPLLRPAPIKTPLEQLMQDPVSLALMFVFGVTLAPLCEELAFRGLFQPLVVRALGAPAGILVAAAPFALMHGSEYAWSWQMILLVFLAGSTFGWVRHVTGSTLASTLVHSGFNFTMFLAFIVNKLGTHG
jgi:uncharacterized protein